MIEFAHATRERQLEARSVAHTLAVRHGLSLQELAERVGIPVDTVANLLEKEPVSLTGRLRMSEESVDALLEHVAKRRRWVSAQGGHDERLHLDSVILRTLFTRAPTGFAVLDTDLRRGPRGRLRARSIQARSPITIAKAPYSSVAPRTCRSTI
jgi:hypothetical protein